MHTGRIRERIKKVLIVTSDENLSLLLGFLLDTDGFQVAVSQSPDLAVQTLLKDAPDAIFLDLHVQGGNSSLLLEFIRQTFPTVSIFTVVRPEFRSPMEEWRGAHQDCILTPIDYHGVRALLGRCSQPRQTRRRLPLTAETQTRSDCSKLGSESESCSAPF